MKTKDFGKPIPLNQLVSREPNPEDVLLIAEDRCRLEAARSRLPVKVRASIDAKFRLNPDSSSIEEVARRFGVESGTVYQWCRTGVKQLQGELSR